MRHQLLQYILHLLYLILIFRKLIRLLFIQLILQLLINRIAFVSTSPSSEDVVAEFISPNAHSENFPFEKMVCYTIFENHRRGHALSGIFYLRSIC
ncbi:unnamed protein product [Brugia timori]|uniref:Secreted protein n=1 Tax=Brugia timori TaxID=42155 RepID=A0A0R3Q4S0_9BILA|nr:unnamed protein product [Brugia timori]